MKTGIILALFLAACANAWHQANFNPEHKYVAGSKNDYAFKLTAKTSLGEIALTADIAQAVKKVYENGDADIETAVKNTALTIDGNPRQSQDQPASTIRIDKFGTPLNKPDEASTGRGTRLNFLRYGLYYGEKLLAVGDTYTIDRKEKDDPSLQAKGTGKLLGVEGGKARLQISVDVTSPQSEKPMHMDATAIVDSATGLLVDLSGQLKDMPLGPGASAANASFTFARKSKT
ncbi:MAG TPA: hypothetical protein VG820_01035 [Fimbriimonadaceae bacterium]|nr:hypothetical protein [Fimbriimonadaceae bacterium]